MKKIRVIMTGALVWALVLTVFTVLTFIPATKNSEILQLLIVGSFLVPFAWLGAFLYYKNGATTHGLTVALLMVGTALLLDALVTVPVMIIPEGGSYVSFFTNPILWILVGINLITVYVYWHQKVKARVVAV